MKSIINSISKTYFTNRKYTYSRDEILSYQDEFLIDLMTKNQGTLVGKKYNFADVYSYEDFLSNVPVFHYDNYKEYIYMSVKGQDNVICSDKIDFWAKTSGTTNDYHKYIPVTKRYLENNHYKSSKDILSRYINVNPSSKIFEGKNIILGGNMGINEFTGESNVGYISAILQNNTNPIVKMFWTEPDSEISFMTNRNEKVAKIIESCKDQNITSTIGTTGRNIYMLNDFLRILNKSFVDEIWPNYELFLTGAMDYRPLESSIRKIFSKPINIWQTYNCSEGYIGIQLLNDTYKMGLCACHDIYYEFIKHDDYINNKYNLTIKLSDVVIDEDYVILITTSTGLYRYVLGDTVKFYDLELFQFEITGRTKTYLDSFAEHLRENHTNIAIQKISKKYKIDFINYHVGVKKNIIGDGSGFHQRIIELGENIKFDKEYIYLGNGNDKVSNYDIIACIDQYICEINLIYESKRSGDILLQKPKIQIVPSGTFHKWFEAKGKLGGQNKIPKLQNDDKIIKEINDLL